MDGADASATMTSTNASGCGADSASRAGRLSRFCPIGWLHLGTTAFTAGSSLASGSPPAILPSKLHRTARIRHACPIHPPCADGLNGACQPLVLDQGWSKRPALSADAHHPRLGSGRALPYSADRGKKSVNRHALDELKQQIPLLDYLQAHDWRPARPHRLSAALWDCVRYTPITSRVFCVDPHKNLFYCYGCRRGGDVIRFVELYHQVEFPQAIALLNQWRGLAPLLPGGNGSLSPAATSSQRCRCLSTAAWSPLCGADRTYADRLCTRRMLTRPPGSVGLPARAFASSRPGDGHRP